MNSTTGELGQPGGATLTGERLAELLSVLAEAPDYHSAARFALEQFMAVAGADRGCILALTRTQEQFEPVAWVGFPDDAPPRLELSVDDLSHPAVAAALSQLPMRCEDAAAARLGALFRTCTAVPLPQPARRGAPPLLGEARAIELVAGRAVPLQSAAVERRFGHSPSGVLLVEAIPGPEQTSTLSHAGSLVGPVLARLQELEEHRGETRRASQRHELLTTIVASLPDPIVITDASNDILVQNRRAEHLFASRQTDSEGRRRAVEINNLLFTSFLSKTMMAGGKDSGSRELNLVDPDEGADLLFEVLAHPLTTGTAGDGAFVSLLRDVTDLRRASLEVERQFQRVRLAEIEASRERDRLNLILENVADPILVTDDRSNIILMNRQAEELFEVSALREPRDRRQRAAVQGNDTKFTTFISDFTLSPAPSRREQMALVSPLSGLELPVEVVSGKILNERGEPIVIVSVVHDLSKQVDNERLYEELKRFSSQLEERIRAATQDLAEQNARLQWQARELEKANRLKSDFLASMSHELRTPINALIGYTALMLDRIYGDVTPKQEEGLIRIRASAQHLLALINDILDLAKIEAGKMPLHLEDVALSDLVREIVQQIEPLVRKKALDFRWHVPAERVIMHTDRTKVKQILLNLLSNAVKFTHQGFVALTVTRHGENVQFVTSDSGIGIQHQDLEVIWEDFRQLDQSRTREYGGTGLGLSITRKLVQQLGGTASVESEFGVGSTFVVTLPVRSEPLRAPDTLGLDLLVPPVTVARRTPVS